MDSTATRDHVVFYLNGTRQEVPGPQCFTMLAQHLRGPEHLTGTKVFCDEGDCGACSVLVGRPSGDTIHYLPVDACIQFLFQLDGTHVVTVEGLADHGEQTALQRAFMTCDASQCGFCTPGFVVAGTAACEHNGGGDLSRETIQDALSGTLCRCTGYVSIIQALESVGDGELPPVSARYPDAKILPELLELVQAPFHLHREGDGPDDVEFVNSPTSLDDALEFRSQVSVARVVAGATDLGVQRNKGGLEQLRLLDISRVAELRGVEVADGVLRAGATATWSEILAVAEEHVPKFAEILRRFGGDQIRNVATIGGNVINASPIADSVPFLMVCDATLVLQGAEHGVRRVRICEFYTAYKTFDLRPSELLVAVEIPLPAADQHLFLLKASRKGDLDIATFTGAMLLRLNGETIEEVALAYGGVDPTVHRMSATEAFLQGREFDEATMCSAGDTAVGEISPITDVRGSAEHRQRLARNFLRLAHAQFAAESAPAPG